MAVDTNFSLSLFQNLKLEDPWLPPKPWESIPSESGLSRSAVSSSDPSPPQPIFDTSTVSEASMVRLAMNALQGVQSALVSIEKLSAAFCSDPADRSFHRIPSLWTWASSTHALGRILTSIGCSGSTVFLLRKFVDYFMYVKLNGNTGDNLQINSEASDKRECCESKVGEHSPYGLVNQAFAVAVGKILEGYISALDTLFASVDLRRSAKGVDASLHTSGAVGCLTGVYSEVTLLEVYHHTKELRTQIQALGSICCILDVASCFSVSSFEDLIIQATFEFRKFPRGGDLLTYLYIQLESTDPVHHALLKFLFFRSCEPYCRFIRSWIYEAKISDPYKEFLVEYEDNLQSNPHRKVGSSMHFPLASIRVRDEVAVPCFLRHFMVPLLRAGQQLQVLTKLLELCHFAAGDHNFRDMLPCWSGFSSFHPTYASPVTLNKGKIEAMVTARSSFYNSLQEKLDNITIKLEIRYQQVVLHDTASVFVGTLNNTMSSTSADGLVSSPDKTDSYLVTDNVDSEVSSSADEFSYMLDPLESSECSSVNSSEEQNESGELIDNPSIFSGPDKKCLSALSFSTSMHVSSFVQKPPPSEESNPVRIMSETVRRRHSLGPLMHSYHNEGTYLSHISAFVDEKGENCPWIRETQNGVDDPDMGLLFCGSLKSPFYPNGDNNSGLHPSKYDLNLRMQNVSVVKEGNSCFSKMVATNSVLIEEASDNGQIENEIHTSSTTLTSQLWKPKFNSNILSMNPMLTKHALFHLMSKPEGKQSTEHRELFSYFAFSSVEDPVKICVERRDSVSRPGFGAEFLLPMDSDTSAAAVLSGCYHKKGCDEDDASVFKSKLNEPYVDLKDRNPTSAHISGGSSWESMLASSGHTINESVGDYEQGLASMFEIPLHYIIDKCLLQEIMLQYKFVSKLTIKLLEEGFDLQEHLLALRRYHFMEVADWAELFISSLWRHKWYIVEADKRISEIQGLLELSVQRSSCEKDHNKDRLFIFTKEQRTIPLSASAIGVHSFDFLGLGYRVDWPVSIVLTSGALNIYAEIFNFLIRVKLAVSALTDVWCTLKDLMHLVSRNHNSEAREREVNQINILMRTRHQVNHFVSTLQQYVLSQLSHVSWCRFLHSLKDMVKDMTDFELVHMAYLAESLQICFLSHETESVARIIENILQCALDFQSCLILGRWGIRLDQDDLSDVLSHINISQVLTIKKKFDKELKELHYCYFKSPKHGAFGLSRFWEYLNYNEYYSSSISNQIWHFPFSI